MIVLSYARQRLKAVLAEIERLKESEFPYFHAREAIDRMAPLFRKLLDDLNKFDNDSDKAIVAQKCVRTVGFLFQYLPLLGFALRSTNVRNAFEVYHPLRRLAGQVLEPKGDKDKRITRLVLSSEWNYSPLTYTGIPQLPGLVLIGMPAHESSNPLIVPLAGHELGHSVWGASNNDAYRDSLKAKIRLAIINSVTAGWKSKNYQVFFRGPASSGDLATNLDAIEVWQPAVAPAMRQAEETFCDFVGVRVFGQSFLHAFGYLLAPKSIGPRSVRYPKMVTRARNHVTAATAYGVAVPADYVSMFEDLDEPLLSDLERFRVSIADEALAGVIDDLLQKARDVIDVSKIALPTDPEAERIYQKFKRVMPDQKAACLADVLNAGWRAHADPDLWADLPELREKRDLVLKELILKNVEILEIGQILKETP